MSKGQTMNRSDPTDLAHSFAYGIDAIGRGDYDRGVAMWEESLAERLLVQVHFLPGGTLDGVPGSGLPDP